MDLKKTFVRFRFSFIIVRVYFQISLLFLYFNWRGIFLCSVVFYKP